MAIEVKRTEQRQTSTGSKSQRVVQVTKFDTHAKQLLKQQTSKTRHDMAGRTCVKANGEAGRACDRQHCGKREYPHGKCLQNNACQRKERQVNNLQAQRTSPTCDKPTQAEDHNQNSSTTQDNTPTTHNFNNMSTICKHNMQALHVTDQRKSTSTTETEAQHNSSQRNAPTSCQPLASTTKREEKKMKPNHHVVHACVGASYRAKCSRGTNVTSRIKVAS